MDHNEKPPSAATLEGQGNEAGASNTNHITTCLRGVERRYRRVIVIEISEFERASARRAMQRHRERERPGSER